MGKDALRERKEHPQRTLVGLELEGNETAGHGDCVHVGRSQVGVITSGTRSPVLRKNVALCRMAVQLVLISVDRRTRMNTMLYEGGHYGVSVLGDTQTELSDRFAGRQADGLPEPRFALIQQTPLVEGGLAHFVARVERSYWGGDHSLFLGRVVYARHREGAPLLFHGGRYERLVTGVPRA